MYVEEDVYRVKAVEGDAVLAPNRHEKKSASTPSCFRLQSTHPTDPLPPILPFLFFLYRPEEISFGTLGVLLFTMALHLSSWSPLQAVGAAMRSVSASACRYNSTAAFNAAAPEQAGNVYQSQSM